MKIAFITEHKFDIHAWSGTNYHIAQALKRNFDLYHIDNLFIPVWIKICMLPKYLLCKIVGKYYPWRQSKMVLKHFSTQITNKIQPDTDLIFMPGSWGLPLVFCKTNLPIVLYQDATFRLLNRFYYKNLEKENASWIFQQEKRALSKSSAVIYSSDWARNSAINDYKIDPNKIFTIPLGANIKNNKTKDDIVSLIKNKKNDICKLLFIGVDWKRKGGDLCVDVVEGLRQQGIEAQLDIVGIKDLGKDLPNYIIDHGFISKKTEEGEQKLTKLFEDAHFLIVPSEAEAYGLVFCEANSFGVPSISRNVGGISSIIINGKNGITFPADADYKAYVDWISSFFLNQNEYRKLAESSYNEYSERLNWDVTADKLKMLISTL